jgi:hypothetical protein
MAARLSVLRAGRTLPPGFFISRDSWYSFLLEAESTPGAVRPEGLGQFKKSTSSGLEPALNYSFNLRLKVFVQYDFWSFPSYCLCNFTYLHEGLGRKTGSTARSTKDSSRLHDEGLHLAVGFVTYRCKVKAPRSQRYVRWLKTQGQLHVVLAL